MKNLVINQSKNIKDLLLKHKLPMTMYFNSKNFSYSSDPNDSVRNKFKFLSK